MKFRPGDTVMLLGHGNCTCDACAIARRELSPGTIGTVNTFCLLCTFAIGRIAYHVEFSPGIFSAAEDRLKKVGDDPDAEIRETETERPRDEPVAA